VVGISTFFPSEEFIFSQVLVVEGQAAGFFINSQARCFGAAGT